MFFHVFSLVPIHYIPPSSLKVSQGGFNEKAESCCKLEACIVFKCLEAFKLPSTGGCFNGIIDAGSISRGFGLTSFIDTHIWVPVYLVPVVTVTSFFHDLRSNMFEVVGESNSPCVPWFPDVSCSSCWHTKVEVNSGAPFRGVGSLVRVGCNHYNMSKLTTNLHVMYCKPCLDYDVCQVLTRTFAEDAYLCTWGKP